MSEALHGAARRVKAIAPDCGWFLVLLFVSTVWAASVIVYATPHGVGWMLAGLSAPWVATCLLVPGSWRRTYRWVALIVLVSWTDPAYLWGVIVMGGAWVLWRSWWVESRPRWSKSLPAGSVVGQAAPSLGKAVLVTPRREDRTKNEPSPNHPRTPRPRRR